jgi:hypothetical protein
MGQHVDGGAQDALFGNITALSAPQSQLACEFVPDTTVFNDPHWRSHHDRMSELGFEIDFNDLVYHYERSHIIEDLTKRGWRVAHRPVAEMHAANRLVRRRRGRASVRRHHVSQSRAKLTRGQNSVGKVDPDRHRSRLQRLGDLGSHQPELATARRDVVIRSEFRYSGSPLISLSHTNIRVVDNVSAPPGAGAVLTDDPRPVVVELHRNGNTPQLAGLAADGLQLGGHRGAQPQLAQPLDGRIEQATDGALSTEFPQRLVMLAVRHGDLRW